MPSRLLLSVVLPTYMRAELLRTNLAHLADQTLAPESYEVIVVDDGSSDHTEDVVRQVISQAPCRITYLKHDNRGPGYSQNRGIRQAEAPVILLLADDIILTRDALAAHLAAHARHHHGDVAILGNVRQAPDLVQTVFQRNWDPFELGRLEEDQELPYSLFWACNISLRRDFMVAHGMFRDERGSNGAAAHEDVEVGHRLAQKGLRIFHDKGALGYHHHPESLKTAIERSYERGLNWDEVFSRMPHPELLIRQRLYGIGTLITHRKELTGARRAFLLAGDRNMSRLAVDAVLRSVLFNRVTVPALWIPLMNLAERHGVVASLMRRRFYRGVVVYYFRKACEDARRNVVKGAGRAAGQTLDTRG